jgi:predicted aspartyl protease
LAGGFSAFTVAYNSRSNVLRSKATIGVAFHPSQSPIPELVEFDAIWDTGATDSVISKKVVDRCGLQPIAMTRVYTASGEENCYVYLVSIRLPNKVGFSNVKVTEGKIAGADLLIGMDLIGIGDFAVTNFENKTVFSYRIPSVSRIDFVEDAKEINRLNRPSIGRNAPCPCGSGKKFKKCHGQNTP